MKKHVALCIALSVLIAVASIAQTTWEFANGPYFVNFDDFAVGVKNEETVLYAADSAEVEQVAGALVLKSTNQGQTWQKLHLPDGGNVRCVATVFDNPDIVYAAILGSGVYKSTNGGTSWTELQNQPSNLYIGGLLLTRQTPT